MAGLGIVGDRIELIRTAWAVVLLASVMACGGGGSDAQPAANAGEQPAAAAAAQPAAGSFDACAVLTREEIAAAVGWEPTKVEPVRWPDGMGRCDYASGKSGVMPPEELEVGIQQCPTNMPCYEDLPNFGSSQELAAYRKKLYEGSSYAGMANITPLEGLGVPAIDHEMASLHAIEMYVAKNRLAFVQTWASAEVARALAEKVLARIR